MDKSMDHGRDIAAFWLYLLATLLLGLTGVVYLFRAAFMPYHAIAVGMVWADVDQNFQIVLLGGIRILGAAWMATATAMGILLLIPFRQGMPWARWSIPLLGLTAGLPALYVTISVTVNTSATAPWPGVVVFILLLCTGLAISPTARRTDSLSN